MPCENSEAAGRKIGKKINPTDGRQWPHDCLVVDCGRYGLPVLWHSAYRKRTLPVPGITMKKSILALSLVLLAPMTHATPASHIAAIHDMLRASHFTDAMKEGYRKKMIASGQAETLWEQCIMRQFDDPAILTTIDEPFARSLSESDARQLTRFYQTHPDLSTLKESDIDPSTKTALTNARSAFAASMPLIQQNLMPKFIALAQQNCGAR
jgi:hypothetical protein